MNPYEVLLSEWLGEATVLTWPAKKREHLLPTLMVKRNHGRERKHGRKRLRPPSSALAPHAWPQQAQHMMFAPPMFPHPQVIGLLQLSQVNGALGAAPPAASQGTSSRRSRSTLPRPPVCINTKPELNSALVRKGSDPSSRLELWHCALKVPS